MQLVPTDAALELGAVLRDLSEKVGETSPEPLTADAATGWWARIADDGWLDAGDSLSLLDLAYLAEQWGRGHLPVPLTPTVLARRWAGSDVADGTSPVTVVMPTGHRRAIVPFAGFPGLEYHHGARKLRAGPPLADELAELPPWAVVTDLAGPFEPVTADFADEMVTLALAEAAGAAAATLDRARQYALTRHQFSRPIGAFQAVAHHLSNMHVDLELTRSHVVCLANRSADEGVAFVAAAGFRLARRVIERAIQVHGGFGLTWEGGLHAPLRHVIALARLGACVGNGEAGG